MMKRFRLLLFIGLLLALGTCLDAGNIFEHVEQDSLLLKSPVVYKDKVVFYIYSGLGSFSALERSGIVSRRLEDLSEHKHLYRDSLHIYSEEGEYTIRYGDKAIHTVGKADSLILQKPLAEIAQGYHDIIADEFIPLFTQLNIRQGIILIVKTGFFVLLVLGINIFIFRMISRFMSYSAELDKIGEREKRQRLYLQRHQDTYGRAVLPGDEDPYRFIALYFNCLIAVFYVVFLALGDSWHTQHSAAIAGLYHDSAAGRG